uniref:Uncharacterized protein n=1 Tax=Acrobeloides nanus TaxID=290746 RepID=A0A914DBG7_9BILA
MYDVCQRDVRFMCKSTGSILSRGVSRAEKRAAGGDIAHQTLKIFIEQVCCQQETKDLKEWTPGVRYIYNMVGLYNALKLVSINS